MHLTFIRDYLLTGQWSVDISDPRNQYPSKWTFFGDSTDPATELLIRAAIYMSHFSVWLHNYRFRIFLT